MNSKEVLPYIEPIPEENRLVRQARAGDAAAYVHLYDAYGDGLYRYIYFRVLSDVAAESMTYHVFRYAWEHLDNNQGKKSTTFVRWIYEIARDQIFVYYKANFRTHTFDVGFLSVAADYGLNRAGQAVADVEAWGNHLQLFGSGHQEMDLQRTATLVMRRYMDYLDPRRVVKASPTFNIYTRPWLLRYLDSHQRHPKQVPVLERAASTYAALSKSLRVRVRLPSFSPMFQRTAMGFATLALMLVVTGTTARAQSALPGDPLYGLKRTTEQAWLSISPDPLGTDIELANRRLGEWMAVRFDPARSAGAKAAYLEALSTLSRPGSAETRARLMPMLRAHRETLTTAGLSSTAVDAYLSVAANPSPVIVPATQVPPTSVLAAVATQTSQRATAVPPTAVPPTATFVPPTATEVPPTATEIPPTPTDMPTATDVPTATNVPTATEVPPATATDVPPTDVPPTPVVVPTDSGGSLGSTSTPAPLEPVATGEIP